MLEANAGCWTWPELLFEINEIDEIDNCFMEFWKNERNWYDFDDFERIIIVWKCFKKKVPLGEAGRHWHLLVRWLLEPFLKF